MFVWYEYLIIAVYILFILFIGAYFTKKGSENVDEYFLGGKSLPWWVLGISFMTSNLDLTGTMLIASFFAMAGLQGFLVEMRGGTALALAFFMVFMAKWHRRAGVMTVAEWMEVRFGKDRGADAARLVSAVAVVVLVLGMMVYFCVGFGKFLSLYLPWGPTTCTIVFTSVATVHILFSGLYGVAFTDVFQGFMILFVVVYLSVLAFMHGIDTSTFQEAWQAAGNTSMTWDKWVDLTPVWRAHFPSGYEQYNALGFLMIFWALRMVMEGFGGPLIPYASQRFFAAKNDREASLVTGSSMAMFVVRWPLIIGVAVLGLGLGSAIPKDPEMVFPAVLGHYFPAGIRAVVVSCMVAAAMSTFDSTVNAGGAYLINDIYKRFINPEASSKKLIRLSWAATVGLTAIAIILASLLTSINEIWSWISMGLFGGMAIPFILRWYWERYNGWGYAAGTLCGVLTAVAQKFFAPQLSEAFQLVIVGSVSLVVGVAATYLTAATPKDVITDFYRRTRPFGWWPRARADLSQEEKKLIRRENKMDFISIPFAVGFFFFLFVCPMYLIIHRWDKVFLTLAVAVMCGVVLYFTWYKNLGCPQSEGNKEGESPNGGHVKES